MESKGWRMRWMGVCAERPGVDCLQGSQGQNTYSRYLWGCCFNAGWWNVTFFPWPLMQLITFTYKRNANLHFTELCLLLQSKILHLCKKNPCWSLKGMCRRWIVQVWHIVSSLPRSTQCHHHPFAVCAELCLTKPLWSWCCWKWPGSDTGMWGAGRHLLGKKSHSGTSSAFWLVFGTKACPE